MSFACCVGNINPFHSTVQCWNASTNVPDTCLNIMCPGFGGNFCWFMPNFVCEQRPCEGFRHPCCTHLGCSMRTLDDCGNQLGGSFPGGTTCTPDPCDTWACCVSGGTGGCSNRTLEFCRSSGGTWKFGKRCDDTPDPCPPGQACCLCKSQCKNLPDEDCARLNGRSLRSFQCFPSGLGICERDYPDRDPACGGVRFQLARDTLRDNDRFRPASIDRMNAHELVEWGVVNDCRSQWGNMSAKEGPWTCGQWDMHRPETKKNYKLKLSLDTNGRAFFHTRYFQACQRYQ